MHSSIDLSIFNKFNFEMKPVGIKYLLNKPDDMRRFDKSLPICQMFRDAQTSPPFYADRENFACMETVVMGMREAEPFMESGEIGATEGIFKEARANRRIYQEIPKLAKNTVRYVAFSSFDQLSFDPDVLTITANVSQAEIILRALRFSTGKPIITKSTLVVMCAWLFVYPFVSGEVNFTVTGLGYGMKVRNVFPEGLILISIPFDLLSTLVANLQSMQWVLPLFTMGDEEKSGFFKKTTEEIRQRYMDG